jgi:hypothetical protein
LAGGTDSNALIVFILLSFAAMAAIAGYALTLLQT